MAPEKINELFDIKP